MIKNKLKINKNSFLIGMFSEERNLKKSTGIYRCIDDINNLSIRVQIKEITNESLTGNSESKDVESKNIRWQQKIFSRWERSFYKDKNNCIADLDFSYHEEVVKILENDEHLYSYVNVDDFCLEEEAVCDTRNGTFVINRVGYNGPKSKHMYDMLNHIQDSARNPFFANNFEYMYIMADFGEYIDDTWIKSEYILCSLKYDYKKKTLLIYPDFTIFYPYKLIINNDLTKIYEYTIENTSESVNPELLDNEREILNKIANHEKKLKEQTIGTDFTIPPRNRLYVYLFCEILTGKNFEYNDIYVQYFIDLPENLRCLDQNSLKGTTQACHTKTEDKLAHFGFPFELVLCFDVEKLEQTGTLKTPYIYFEVISKDSWDRYRTEGLSYVNLPISQPGKYNFELHCLRILPTSLSGNLRRFFIGDYKSYEDITWISKPKDHDDIILNKYGVDTIGTGELSFRINVIHQSQAFLEDVNDMNNRKEKVILDKLASSSLIKSVEQVLDAFKKARKNMMEARRKV